MSHPSPLSERELILVRETDVPAAKLYAGWTQPDLLMRWFTPAPWSTVACELDLRPGGIFRTTMRSPEGEEHPNIGVYLEIIPGEKLVFTDAYVEAWVPSAEPFMTATITLSDEVGGTLQLAAVAAAVADDEFGDPFAGAVPAGK